VRIRLAFPRLRREPLPVSDDVQLLAFRAVINSAPTANAGLDQLVTLPVRRTCGSVPTTAFQRRPRSPRRDDGQRAGDATFGNPSAATTATDGWQLRAALDRERQPASATTTSSSR
jgi:hypothetical protein